jgi:hypothetical protein
MLDGLALMRAERVCALDALLPAWADLANLLEAAAAADAPA